MSGDYSHCTGELDYLPLLGKLTLIKKFSYEKKYGFSRQNYKNYNRCNLRNSLF